jgi:hypothetical protein
LIELLLRRLLQSVVVIAGVTVITFTTLHLGGDPTYLYVSERASEEEIVATRAKLGFDQPLRVQYLRFADGLLHGDLGDSLTYHTPALGVVLERFPATLELTFCAMLIALCAGIPLGVLAALKHGRPLDGGIMLLAMLGQSMPSFWLGLLLILSVGLKFRWLPISGRVPVLDPLFAGDLGTAWANLPHALPGDAQHDHRVFFAGAHRPPGAFVDARGPVAGLRAHRPRQGLVRISRGGAPCAAQRVAAGNHHAGPGIRLPVERRGGGRDRFLMARGRQTGI